jgi:hypothetical protein
MFFCQNNSHDTSAENETPLLTPRSISIGQQWQSLSSEEEEKQRNRKNKHKNKSKNKKSSKSYDENVDQFLAANQVMLSYFFLVLINYILIFLIKFTNSEIENKKRL